MGQGWSPPGVQADKDSWQYDVQKGWVGIGQQADASGLQLDLPRGINPLQNAGYQLVVSPPGVPAPLQGLNYTPSLREVHAPGAPAPINQMNLTAMPTSQVATIPPVQNVSPEDALREILSNLGMGVGQGTVGTGADSSLDAEWARLPIRSKHPYLLRAGYDEEAAKQAWAAAERPDLLGQQTQPTAPASGSPTPQSDADIAAFGLPQPPPPGHQVVPSDYVRVRGMTATDLLLAAESLSTSPDSAGLTSLARNEIMRRAGMGDPDALRAAKQLGLPYEDSKGGNPYTDVINVGGRQVLIDRRTGDIVKDYGPMPVPAYNGPGRNPYENIDSVALPDGRVLRVDMATGAVTELYKVDQTKLIPDGSGVVYKNPDTGKWERALFPKQDETVTLSNGAIVRVKYDENGDPVGVEDIRGAEWKPDPKQFQVNNRGAYSFDPNTGEFTQHKEFAPEKSIFNVAGEGIFAADPMTGRTEQTFTFPKHSSIQGNDVFTPGGAPEPDIRYRPDEWAKFGYDEWHPPDMTKGQGSWGAVGTGADGASEGAQGVNMIDEWLRLQQMSPGERAQWLLDHGIAADEVGHIQPEKGGAASRPEKIPADPWRGRDVSQWEPPGDTVRAKAAVQKPYWAMSDVERYQAFQEGKLPWNSPDPNRVAELRQKAAGLGPGGVRDALAAARTSAQDYADVASLTKGGPSVSGAPKADWSDILTNKDVQTTLDDMMSKPWWKQAARKAGELGQDAAWIAGKAAPALKAAAKVAAPVARVAGPVGWGLTAVDMALLAKDAWDQGTEPREMQWQGTDYNPEEGYRIWPESKKYQFPTAHVGGGQDSWGTVGVGGPGQIDDPMGSMGQQGGPPDQAWVPPIAPPDVEGMGNRFGQQVNMEGTHKGTDIQAVQGTPIHSPVDGVIVAVNFDPKGLGLKVIVEDMGGHKHTLAHMNDASVKPGDMVQAGQPVGTVGSTGAGSTGPHLDVREQDPAGNYLNPERNLPDEMRNMPQSPNTVQEGGMVGSGTDVPPPGYPSGPWDAWGQFNEIPRRGMPPGEVPVPKGWQPPKVGKLPTPVYRPNTNFELDQWFDVGADASDELAKHPYFGSKPYKYGPSVAQVGGQPAGGQTYSAMRYDMPEGARLPQKGKDILSKLKLNPEAVKQFLQKWVSGPVHEIGLNALDPLGYIPRGLFEQFNPWQKTVTGQGQDDSWGDAVGTGAQWYDDQGRLHNTDDLAYGDQGDTTYSGGGTLPGTAGGGGGGGGGVSGTPDPYGAPGDPLGGQSWRTLDPGTRKLFEDTYQGQGAAMWTRQRVEEVKRNRDAVGWTLPPPPSPAAGSRFDITPSEQARLDLEREWRNANAQYLRDQLSQQYRLAAQASAGNLPWVKRLTEKGLAPAYGAPGGSAGFSPVGQQIAAGTLSPNFKQWQERSPHERAAIAYQTEQSGVGNWNTKLDQWRQAWGQEGITGPPSMTSLGWATATPEKQEGWGQLAESLGQSGTDALSAQRKVWDRAQASGVQQRA